MAIPSSGPVSFTTIQTEFGGSNPIGMNEYYAGGAYVPNGTSGTYGAVPTSGQISVRNFYGTTAASAPANTVAPSVTGTGAVNTYLNTTTGTWTGTPTITYAYQWYYSSGSPISGQTSSSIYMITAYIGLGIYCRVTATNGIGSTGANSNTVYCSAGAPTAPGIGTAYSNGPNIISVPYTAPTSDGGATITQYAALSNPGGIAGYAYTFSSGTIDVSGLTNGTTYSFTVTASNSAGTSPPSAQSNSVLASASGSRLFTSPGSYTWIAPTGVTKVSVLVVGAGGRGGNALSVCCCTSGIAGGGGGGGGMAYISNYSVTPGTGYTVFVPNNCCYYSTAYWRSTCTVGAGAGQAAFYCGGGSAGGGYPSCPYNGARRSGGAGAQGNYYPGNYNMGGGGGGGAAGYAGGGGVGGSYSGGGGSGTGGAGAGGGGGGFYPTFLCVPGGYGGGGGGGLGVFGQGCNGIPGAIGGYGGGGGSGGVSGQRGGQFAPGGVGGSPGGGAGGNAAAFYYGGMASGGSAAVRIIWPGCSRYFPSTCAGSP